MSESSTPWPFVMEAVDAGLMGAKLLAYVRSKYTGTLGDVSLRTFASAYRCWIGPVLRGEPCDGSPRSRAVRMLQGGETPLGEISLATGLPNAQLSTLKKHLGCATFKRPRQMQAQRFTALTWPTAKENGRHPTAPLRSNVTIAEAIMLAFAEGNHSGAHLHAAVEKRLGRQVRPSVVASKAGCLRLARFAVDGHRNDSSFNRVAHRLLEGAGNSEVVEELGISANVVASIRSYVRTVQASSLPVDPTFHRQPSQDHPRQQLPEWSGDRETRMEPRA